jgi:hypothetical protein
MPHLDFSLIEQLGRDLHTTSPGVMSEDQICPWTLFLTMALTLLKGVLPHVPRMLPVLISDPEMRERVAETFTSEEFINNIESYFVQNIKNDIQAPINRQIIKSSETIMYFIDVFEGLAKSFFSGDSDNNDVGTTDNKPRSDSGYNMLGQVLNFAKVVYNLAK